MNNSGQFNPNASAKFSNFSDNRKNNYIYGNELNHVNDGNDDRE